MAHDLANLRFSDTPVMHRYDSSVTGSCTKYLDVNRWSITKFDRKSSISNFLERIEELRVSRGVSKDQLFRSATELFTDSALTWFRWARQTVFTWMI